MITHTYKVADHLFSVTATAEQLAIMTNYAPFLTHEEGAPVFHLTIEDTPYVAPETVAHVFTDTSDEDMPRIEVYRAGTDWLFHVSLWRDTPVCCHLRASAMFDEAQLWIDTTDVRFAIDNATMLLYAFRTAGMRTLEMHASVIERGGKAQLFLGHSGTGKSTHSRLWQEAFDDCTLMNDDNPILRVMDSGEVRVFGSPWSGKTPCYKQISAPVRGIVKLSQAPHNEMRPLRLPEAYAYMLSSASGLKIERPMMDALYETIAYIIQHVPTYHLDCLPNTDAARLCYETLAS